MWILIPCLVKDLPQIWHNMSKAESESDDVEGKPGSVIDKKSGQSKNKNKTMTFVMKEYFKILMGSCSTVVNKGSD
ncbi:hypothetical protein C0J52_02403 [Blattella germanica]|nr:hypothetical protein C0J52_02403 [Blattella germanica]